MKAYKFRRSNIGPHWSMGGTDHLVYFPEMDVLFYASGNDKGVCVVERILEEAKKYIDDVKSNKIKNNYEPSLPNAYSNNLSFVKKISEHKVGNITYMPVFFDGFEELIIEIDAEKIKEIVAVNEIIIKEKEKLDKFLTDFPQLTLR